MRALCLFVATTLLFIISLQAVAQSCPPKPYSPNEAPDASTLHGTLIYHNELRQWLGLEVDEETCGVDEIQLVFKGSENWRQAEAQRGCKVTVIGRLYYTLTGYYSARMAISDPVVTPDVTCKPFPVKSDPSLVPKKANLKKFIAEIIVDYRNGGHVGVRIWEDQQRKSELTPWQPYLHYSLTGARDVIWFHCADGFEITHLSQEPKPEHGLFQDEPNFAGTVLPSETVNTITFTCTRDLNSKTKP